MTQRLRKSRRLFAETSNTRKDEVAPESRPLVDAPFRVQFDETLFIGRTVEISGYTGLAGKVVAPCKAQRQFVRDCSVLGITCTFAGRHEKLMAYRVHGVESAVESLRTRPYFVRLVAGDYAVPYAMGKLDREPIAKLKTESPLTTRLVCTDGRIDYARKLDANNKPVIDHCFRQSVPNIVDTLDAAGKPRKHVEYTTRDRDIRELREADALHAKQLAIARDNPALFMYRVLVMSGEYLAVNAIAVARHFHLGQ